MVMVFKRYKDYTNKKRKPEVTPHKMGYLKDLLRRYQQELDEAEWNDELPSTIAFLRRRVEMAKIQIALGEVYDVPF